MTFDASAHPRSADGTFTEKTGAAPEVVLGERTPGMQLLHDGLQLDGYWGSVADHYGLTLEERGYFSAHLKTLDESDFTPETRSTDLIFDALQASVDNAESEDEKEEALERQRTFGFLS